MKIKINWMLFFGVLVVFFGQSCYGALRFSWGIKGGLNVSQFCLPKSYLKTQPDNSQKYEYPLTGGIGLFGEKKFSEHFSIINELSWLNIRSEVTSDTWEEGILHQMFNGDYLRLPCLLKCQLHPAFYFFCGPDFGVLLNANYKYFDEIYVTISDNREITEHLPAVDVAVDLGIGTKIPISNIAAIFEIRGYKGLTRYDYLNIVEWQNTGVQFLFGIQF